MHVHYPAPGSSFVVAVVVVVCVCDFFCFSVGWSSTEAASVDVVPTHSFISVSSGHVSSDTFIESLPKRRHQS